MLDQVVQVLLEHGADVTSRDDTHSTPLHLASLNAYPGIVRLLIEHGADVNARDRSRNTPLFLALSSWQLKFMWLLIESDVPVNRRHRSLLPELLDLLASPKRSPLLAALNHEHTKARARARGLTWEREAYFFGVSVKTG